MSRSARPLFQPGLVLCCFLAVMISYVDRINISVAILPMSEEFGWSHSSQGAVLSFFFVGYILTQVVGGSLADRYGGTIVLGIGVLLWSLFCALTPLAARLGVPALFAARVGLGVGEGVAFPSIYALLGQWLPQENRGRAVGIVFAGIPAGSVIGLATTTPIVQAFGWEPVFYIAGAVGLTWAAGWYGFMGGMLTITHRKASGGDQGGNDSSSGSESSDSEDGETESKSSRGPQAMSVTELLRHGPVWAILSAHLSSNWSCYVLLCWMPTYLKEGLGVDFSVIGWLTMLPHIAGFFCLMFIAGILADALISYKMPVGHVRKLMSSIGLGGMMVCLLVVSLVTSPPVAIAVMATGSFLSSFCVGGHLCNHLDLAPGQAGTIMGITNTAATIPGIVGVYVSGRILDATGSWLAVFWVAAGVQGVGLALFLALGSGELLRPAKLGLAAWPEDDPPTPAATPKHMG